MMLSKEDIEKIEINDYMIPIRMMLACSFSFQILQGRVNIK
jgi:hypothetical protein